MRRVIFAALLLLVCPIVFAQHFHHAATSDPDDAKRVSPCVKDFAPAVLDVQLQKVTWEVTGNAEAKLFFSQGMTEYYGFNYEEALRNFRGAKTKDPGMAMASWGIALAAGPNINLAMDDPCRKLGIEESLKAEDLAKTQKGITDVEIGLIKALPLQYAGPMTETVAYSVAMRAVWSTAKANWKSSASVRDAQNVANVGALYAESMLEMRPWGLFDAAYKPALDTDAIYQVLKEAMAADEKAIGPNHFWIHTAEASDDPKEAEKSATLLHTAAPKSGHLVHMPSHIEFLLGDYGRAMESNSAAINTDMGEYGVPCGKSYADYSTNPLCPQLYYGHYLAHNLFFRSVSAAFWGQSKEALDSARATRKHVERFMPNEPGLQRYMTAPLMALVMNRCWTEILGPDIDRKAKLEQEAPESCYMQPFQTNGCHILRSMWFWEQGMAHAALSDFKASSTDYNAMAEEMKQIAPPATGWGNNSAVAVLAIAQSMLQARYTWGRGQCQPSGQCKATTSKAICIADYQCYFSRAQAIEHLKLAVTHADALVYDEPPQWFPPAREALGGAYLQDQQYAKAIETFEEALHRNPDSGRALYGLIRARCGATPDSTCQDELKKFDDAWGKHADYTMQLEDLWPGQSAGKEPPLDGDAEPNCSPKTK